MGSQGKIVLPAAHPPTASSEKVYCADRVPTSGSGANAASPKKPVFLGDNGKPLRFFHGTPKDEFVDFQPSETGEAGRGIYFTDDPAVASEYAQKEARSGLRWFESFGELENWAKDEYGTALPWGITKRWSEVTVDLPSGDHLDITNVEGRYKVFFPLKDPGEEIQGANVRPAFLRITNPLDLRVVVTAEAAVAFAEGLASAANETLSNNVLDRIRYQGQQPRRFAFSEVREAVGAEKLQHTLEGLGYDGTVIREGETNGLSGYNAYTVFSADDVVPAFSPDGVRLASGSGG